MSIAILPARLANQIAAGEVVERPASVIKELIENSLDAGATSIQIDVDKGGIKKIKITDNGHGIVKDELTLALSRHATSKIKDLNDLEAIDSLGFRGEALASISSVSRLTLTSKPKDQTTAWQAVAEGRDMSVNVKPAAHPDGTSIEALDLFFNTPARRKFLRTEKTEFNHIDEVVRRIALAHFCVSFTLTHNGNTVRQYRIASTHVQQAKRVAMVCGPKFIEHAVEVDCPHDNMTLSGWLTKPSFSRSQNDLCYSYVNGRMMRDKLINHAIRQAYADLLPPDTYPAFVLFLKLDHKEVDVNVHPAKHEVRFHQSRYVHDFIYSVCHKALTSALAGEELFATPDSDMALVPEQSYSTSGENEGQGKILSSSSDSSVNYPRADYVKPLQHVNDTSSRQSAYGYSGNSQQTSRNSLSPVAANNYQSLMTPHVDVLSKGPIISTANKGFALEHELISEYCLSNPNIFISLHQPGYALYKTENKVRVLSLFKLAASTFAKLVEQSWQKNIDQSNSTNEGLVSQPLLLPVMVRLSDEQLNLAIAEQEILSKAGVIFVKHSKNKIQIRQFPALLREQDVSQAFVTIIDELIKKQSKNVGKQLCQGELSQSLAVAMILPDYDETQTDSLLKLSIKLFNDQLSQQLLLNSIPLDLTSHIKQLT
ncbi:DNA mismatch repair endonuclease MutL [Colwellia psychrerythraea]|uniref:DNA mismatch repair protein MutL n=1 Tax=Colwellia psychrerythraea TaxID=28229 RepID=A0A099L382_COLPS|nr:DNA mismatch repair endonuclease MutL [Colwellia psychrerythraea]KGJ97316.1 DNA mismatch repair protein mutL [Colwellia psychrerythraea]